MGKPDLHIQSCPTNEPPSGGAPSEAALQQPCVWARPLQLASARGRHEGTPRVKNDRLDANRQPTSQDCILAVPKNIGLPKRNIGLPRQGLHQWGWFVGATEQMSEHSGCIISRV